MKLIEVALPLDAINAASVREKSIRHGHPSTLHLWWARRPLAACRAVLFAQLVDDPSSHPDRFPTSEAVDAERERLFGIIEKLVKWENSTNEEVLEQARAEIRKSCGDELPPVCDPFSGGGSIPLEAQRLGLPTCGSDLNPVAVVLGKAMIEIPPKFRDMEPTHPGARGRNHYRNVEGLAEDVRHYGEWMRERAFERIGHLYPKADLPGGGKARVIAWIWARTVPSPDPAFSDKHVPIASSFLLSSRSGKEAWIEPIVDRVAKTIAYRIRTGGTKTEVAAAKAGTKVGRGANFRCLLSAAAITPDYVKSKSMAGAMGQTLIAIVAEGRGGRIYLDPTAEMEVIAESAKPSWKPDQIMNRDTRDLVSGRGYGFFTWADLFTDRQLVALTTFSDLVHEARVQIERDALAAEMTKDTIPLREGGKGAKAYAEAVSVYLACALNRLADRGSTICGWDAGYTKIRNTFGRQAIPMVWDFAEGNPFCASTGNWTAMCEWVWKAINEFVPKNDGTERQHDAQTVDYSQRSVISTDPPYYDNIGYANLSDFFFCWMKPLVRPIYPDLFEVLATPKSEELVAAAYRHGGKAAAEAFFLDGMSKVISRMAWQPSSDYPATIYYAFKQSEIQEEGISSTGWATFLQAVVEAGFVVVGTWPMRTELPNRMVALGTNALASSVVLVCRKREAGAEVISRAEFIQALKTELPPAISEMKKASIAPADVPQSAIGPGMGVYSRHGAVLESDDSRMSIQTALQMINRELDDFLNDMQGEFDTETRFGVTWFEQNGVESGDFGIADSIARARGISVVTVSYARIVESAAGRVRILRRDELPDDLDWTNDMTHWVCLQYLVRSLERDGEYKTATLLKRFGGGGNPLILKDLAYCLYDVCANKRHDAAEASAYNALIAVWPELTRLAASIRTSHEIQTEMDL